MKVKGVEFENWSHYKTCAMFIAMPTCSFKCDKECGKPVCQNSKLAFEPIIDVDIYKLAESYCNDPISKAIVFGGLEPFDNITDLYKAIYIFRQYTQDPIIIYTGYTKEELQSGEIHQGAHTMCHDIYTSIIKKSNIIIKYGRFIPNDKEKYNEILGVNLASQNQYAIEYNCK